MVSINEENNVFKTLNAVDCSEHVERRGNLSYLSWGWAWQMVKSHYPDATYRVIENAEGWIYHTDGRTCWVKTGVTIGGLEHIEYLPIMDFKNRSIPLESVTSMDVNKAIQRSLTKAIARHGLGLSLYTGTWEDLPEASERPRDQRQQQTSRPDVPPPTAQDYYPPSWRQSRNQYISGGNRQ